ncbi:MAG TPA: hypothetical protein EYN66_12295 [Myxococcales bacterium]|nr:hypothetical protein [Myxococcales bacterium]
MTRHLSLFLLLFCLACGGNSDDSATDNGTTDDGTTDGTVVETELTVVSWNVGLAHGYVPLGAARQPHVIAALDTIDADVICLQELWTEDDREAARAALEARGYNTHIHVPEIESEFKSACQEDLLLALKACLLEQCPETIGTDGMTTCAVDKCPTRVAPLGSDCIGCLTKDLTEHLDDIITRCIAETEVVPYSYSGHNGLLLATKTEMTAIAGVDLTASLTFRSYIQATINTSGLGDITLACTHLSADLSVPYMGEFSGFPEEQSYQITDMLGALPADTPVILMGDMNTGPDIEDIQIAAELADNYQQFVDALWNSHLLSQCTWCPEENTLIGPGGNDHIIDHVMTHGVDSSKVVSTRILAQKVTITNADNEEEESNLSDHFGVQVKMTLTATKASE